MAPSAMAGTISFRVFSSLDDGTGYVTVEHILDLWHEEGIENSHEIMKVTASVSTQSLRWDLVHQFHCWPGLPHPS